ncbi:MAG TPA: hypothetical protein VGO53_12010 [Steroidobacteraceae bacterium]|nr:hypothetical protein [Steroidobacteraceae bacterium]
MTNPNTLSPAGTRVALIASLVAAAATLALPDTAHATDFRTLNFGAPCDNVTRLEAAQSSTPLDEQLPSGYQYAFRARYLDRDAVVGYSCKDGAFFRGAYIFQARDEADASSLYKKLKQRVTHERGAPSYDFASSEYRQKMHSVGATLSEADKQVAFWNGKRDEAHLSVGQPSGTRGWRVSLSYTADGH